MQEQQESDPATKHPANHTRIAVSEKKDDEQHDKKLIES